jgi:lipooligosaccharide transport system permease protein
MALVATPAAGGRRAVLGYKAVVSRRYWRSALITGVVTPLMYVLALGVGLGVVVNRHSDQLGVPYLQFVAPAFLTAAALQIAAADATFPVMAGFKWQRFYHAMAATPLRPEQICDAELTWIAIRLTGNSVLYLAIMASFGGARSGWAVLTVPVAVLTGVAFAAPLAAVGATVESEGNLFNILFRFVVTPMFLFSGTFYPIDRLPEWGRVLAWISPLWHGTELARDAALGGGLDAGRVVLHVAYLGVWLGVGLALARWRFRVRLTA